MKSLQDARNKISDGILIICAVLKFVVLKFILALVLSAMGRYNVP